MTITALGIYSMPAEEYHSDPAPAPSLSNSIAVILASQTPRHAWTAHPRLNPDFAPEERDIFDRGSAAHALLLEGDDRMEVIPYDDFRTKAAKELRDAAREAGRFPLLEKNHDAVRQMVKVASEAVRNCADLSGLTLADGKPEQSAFWTEGGIWLRSRLDWLSNDRKLLIDYKTTSAKADPLDWQRTLMNGWGDMQPAFNLRANAATGGPEDAQFVWLVQEVYPPYACCFVGCAPAMLALGQSKVGSAIAQWRRCMQSGDWPAYPLRIHWIEPPAWAETSWQERQGVGTDAQGIPYDPSQIWEKP